MMPAAVAGYAIFFTNKLITSVVVNGINTVILINRILLTFGFFGQQAITWRQVVELI